MARTVKCPGCGADLTVKDDNRDFMFCEFCGTKVDLIDQRIEHHIVDEARIIEAETERKIKLKHLEMETEEYERAKQKRRQAAKKEERERKDALYYDEANRKLLLILAIPAAFVILSVLLRNV